MKKRETWRQPTPIVQLTVVNMSIQGHMHNFREGIIPHEKYLARLEEYVQELDELTFFIELGRWKPC